MLRSVANLLNALRGERRYQPVQLAGQRVRRTSRRQQAAHRLGCPASLFPAAPVQRPDIQRQPPAQGLITTAQGMGQRIRRIRSE